MRAISDNTIATAKSLRKLDAAMNMSLDGFCDHTAMDANDERIDLDFTNTKTFGGGAIMLYYEPAEMRNIQLKLSPSLRPFKPT